LGPRGKLAIAENALHGEFEQLLAQDLPALNESLKAKGQQPIEPPPAKITANEKTPGSGGSGVNVNLPAGFRLPVNSAIGDQ
jgi:hypothetical protein